MTTSTRPPGLKGPVVKLRLTGDLADVTLALAAIAQVCDLSFDGVFRPLRSGFGVRAYAEVRPPAGTWKG